MSNEELLAAMADLIDRKFDEKFDQKFDEKLGQKFDEKFDQKFDEKFDQKFDEKLDQKFDEKLQPIYTRLDILELKQDRTIKKLDDFQLDMKVAERDINRHIHKLQDEMDTVIEVLKLHELVPVMNQ